MIPVLLEEQIPEPSETFLWYFLNQVHQRKSGQSLRMEIWIYRRKQKLGCLRDWKVKYVKKLDMEIIAPYVDNGVYGYVDSYLYLYDEAGNLISSDDDTGSGKNAPDYHTLK